VLLNIFYELFYAFVFALQFHQSREQCQVMSLIATEVVPDQSVINRIPNIQASLVASAQRVQAFSIECGENQGTFFSKSLFRCACVYGRGFSLLTILS
jgi:hypothetical protein